MKAKPWMQAGHTLDETSDSVLHQYCFVPVAMRMLTHALQRSRTHQQTDRRCVGCSGTTAWGCRQGEGQVYG